MIHSLTVVIKGATTQADVDALILSINGLKGVANVKSNVGNVESYVAEERAKYILRQDIMKLIE